MVTSCSTSAWIAAAVFFLRCERVLHGARAADLLVHFQQIAAELAEAVILSDLALGLPQGRRRRKRLGHSLAVHLAGQTIEGTVTRVALLVAVAALVSAASAGGGDGA